MPKTIKRLPARAVAAPSPVVDQIGAFCYRWADDQLEFLLVTSSHGRWILPKGWPMPGKSARKTAKIEAWEEAGVRKGKASKKAVLKFKTKKQRKSGAAIKTRISVHTIAVETLAKRYPEDDRRKRRWVTVQEAMKRVKDKKLRKAIRALAKNVAQKHAKNAA